MTTFRLLLLFSFVFSTLLSCDFENKIRRLASDPSGRKRNSLKQDEVSSDLSESEPNETHTTATPIKLTKEMRVISGELSGSDLTDWFNIAFPEKGEYEIVVTPSEKLDVSLFLEKNDYAFNQSKNGGAESIKSHAATFIRFGIKREAKTEGTYKIKVLRFAQRKHVELEPNNTASTANDFKLKNGMVGKIDQVGDRDVYKIIAPETARWELQFIPTKGDELTIKFCDDEKLLSCSRIYQVKTETLRIPSFGLPAREKPLYAVVGSEKPSGSYQFLALPLNFADDVAVPEIEPNDSFAMEVESEIPEVSFKGYLKSDKDIDRFEVVNWKRYVYHVNINDPDLRLEIEGETVTAKRDFHSCSKDSAHIAEVKFKNRKDRPAFPGYDYRIFFAERNENFETEPNNKNENAVITESTKRGDTSLSDPDVFLFEIKDEKLEYQLANYSKHDIVVSIADDEGFDVLAPQSVTRNKSVALKFDFPKGKYFVKVLGQSKMCSPYQLSNLVD